MAPGLRSDSARKGKQTRASTRTPIRKTSPAAKKRKTTAKQLPNKDLETLQSKTQPPSSSPPQPKNPQACLLGLPCELRLEIYKYVFDSSLIHVHRHAPSHEDEDIAVDEKYTGPEFTWTPCREVNPRSSLLCLNPKWSGLCPESSRCTYRPRKPTIPTGFAALTWTCRAIQHEAREFFLRSTTVSIHLTHLTRFLTFMSSHAPKQLVLIRRVTLTGPEHWDHNWVFRTAFTDLKSHLPHLEAVGYQGQVSKWTMRPTRALASSAIRPQPMALWRTWAMVNRFTVFDRRVSIAIEGLTYHRPTRWNNGPEKEEHFVYRVYRDGRDDVEGGGREIPFGHAMSAAHLLYGTEVKGPGWTDEDVEVEVQEPGLVEGKRNAKWRQWWREKRLKAFY
ncbi:hypothetical protein BU24DRAFT_425698 [Aaosphaeria arxii CBS 175.79]|uniref:DUF7730 domain-containing protein n=1 Tax=Aaosphaeria arxii CBS 175.79 TaxID=1450172 RepID=A0A6A5XF58_9PLEO|nr:uncharacterized protein BU24DRAFT_425698 [Aaosphaeria arxii CBS 175.79]KAF2011875.1 hypothetical protein BU24DRAFT_425698 [Aaosphaeria arxii CBS 175.79]